VLNSSQQIATGIAIPVPVLTPFSFEVVLNNTPQIIVWNLCTNRLSLHSSTVYKKGFLRKKLSTNVPV
jgi:hypothetical protein